MRSPVKRWLCDLGRFSRPNPEWRFCTEFCTDLSALNVTSEDPSGAKTALP
jgi:hypothetical protein